MIRLMAVLVALFVAAPLTASADTIDFSGFSPGTEISTQYSSLGVTFSAGTSGVLPQAITEDWSAYSPGFSTTQTMLTSVAGTDPFPVDFLITFTTSMTDVSFDTGIWYGDFPNIVVTYTTGSQIYGIDDGSQYASFSSDPSGIFHFVFNDYSGQVNSIYFETTLNDPGAVASITNLSFTPVSSPVPEPGTMILLGSGLVGLVNYGKKRRKK